MNTKETLTDVEVQLHDCHTSDSQLLIKTLTDMQNYHYALGFDLLVDSFLSVECVLFDPTGRKWILPLAVNLDENELYKRFSHPYPLMDLFIKSLNADFKGSASIDYVDDVTCLLGNNFHLTCDEFSTLCFNKPGYFIETLVSIDEIDSYAMEYGYTDFMLLFYRVMWFRLSILFIKGFVNQNFTVRGLDKLLKAENIAIGYTPTTRLTYLLRSMVAKTCAMQLSKKGLTIGSQMAITGNINAYITDILNRWKSYSLEAFISHNRLSVNWRV